MLSPLETGIYSALGVAGAIGLVAGAYAYAAQFPGSDLFGRAMRAPRRAGEIALTFDDGPNPACTPKLLDTLAAHKIKATFFMLGSRAQAQPVLVKRIVDAGHLVGNHSWSHPNLAYTAAAKVRDELERTKDVLEQLSGKPVLFFRPPFGARRPIVFEIARKLGMTVVLWNAMTNDWSDPSADQIAATLAKNIENLAQRGFATNIVLHDGGHREPEAARGPSVNAAAMLAAKYANTHKFVTLDEWR
jgi:peptidoglycan/xylan/chitin deacetylase (PgdA/CDA1 family)